MKAGGNGNGGDLFAPQSRADQIFTRFCTFHAANPRIWELFKKFSAEAVAAGRVRFGAEMIIQRIRWYVHIETRGEDVKINDHYRAYYARMWIATHPETPLFELRKRTSLERPAYENDLAVFHVGPSSAAEERMLMEQLRRLAQ